MGYKMMQKEQPGKRQYGDYVILEKVGYGGMATVFKAIHHATRKIVALKVLHEQYINNDVFHRRLAREAAIMKQLPHPGIVSILEYGYHKQYPYFAMEYVAGGSLVKYFEQTPTFSIDNVLVILEKIADAIDFAHSHDIIHRDLKLENVLLNREGHPMITDFGLAKTLDMKHLTMTGQTVGTPYYVAPECLSRRDTSPDHRADLYSFAIMAYVMLAGDFPFRGESVLQTLLKHYNEAPTPITIYNPQLPDSLNSIFRIALSKNPDTRYQSAAAFVDELKVVLRDFPVDERNHQNLLDTVAVHGHKMIRFMPLSEIQPVTESTWQSTTNLDMLALDDLSETQSQVSITENPSKKTGHRFSRPLIAAICLITMLTGAALTTDYYSLKPGGSGLQTSSIQTTIEATSSAFPLYGIVEVESSLQSPVNMDASESIATATAIPEVMEVDLNEQSTTTINLPTTTGATVQDSSDETIPVTNIGLDDESDIIEGSCLLIVGC